MAEKENSTVERGEFAGIEITDKDMENVRKLREIVLAELRNSGDVSEHPDFGNLAEKMEELLRVRSRAVTTETTFLLPADFARLVELIFYAVRRRSGQEILMYLMSFIKLVIFSQAQSLESRRGREEESGTLFRRIFEAAADTIFLLAPDGSILHANPAAQRALGVSSGELAGRKCYSAIHGRSGWCDPGECTIEKVLRGEVVTGAIHRHRSGDDGWMEVEVSASGIADEEGRIIAVVEVARDVSIWQSRVRELEKRLEELERWRKVTVDRELRMAELKEENRRLRKEIERLRRMCTQDEESPEG